MDSFKALVIDKNGNDMKIDIRDLSQELLPAGDLTVKIAYSSVNYKDALASVPNGNVVKEYPLIPGIDLAGIVISSERDGFKAGDEIIATGYGLGVSHFGGYSEYARIPAEWAVKLPPGLSMKEAMIYGTAGFTAALSVLALQESGLTVDKGPVLVTGATGGVGSVSVAILAKLGYEVVASTGKQDSADELTSLGASRVISREELMPAKARVLEKPIWAGVVDCVGGKQLASILSAVQYGGAVAISGLTGGSELPTTVFPFILRGIRLIGIDSVDVAMQARQQAWKLMASDYKPASLDSICSEITLEQIPEALQMLLGGKSQGRTVVKL
ncbi:acryloyl-CoA reductase [Cohnella lupini]|uniref:Putative YhdH/YhfP family quinone oxidoreductase n=1 Tax=Cohnella lupini TaxID=1294267 RepID=A0A3D9IS40_9BACL|nr:acryloyl-CoA reductase [Cohnella lupini]RED64621.1 putative YhdH/YhfP family quinone oxidoreductase [Cohnella lupini]